MARGRATCLGWGVLVAVVSLTAPARAEEPRRANVDDRVWVTASSTSPVALYSYDVHARTWTYVCTTPCSARAPVGDFEAGGPGVRTSDELEITRATALRINPGSESLHGWGVSATVVGALAMGISGALFMLSLGGPGGCEKDCPPDQPQSHTSLYAGGAFLASAAILTTGISMIVASRTQVTVEP